jgi:protein involved in polysaccharide export with SLBB domain
VSVALAEKGTFDVVVLGQVQSPGVHALPRFQNDIAHALAAAGGLDERAAEMIEVHRRVPIARFSGGQLPPAPGNDPEEAPGPPQPDENPDRSREERPNLADGATMKVVLRVPLRGLFVTVVTEDDVVVQTDVTREDVTLQPGDVVVVPQQQDEVFFVVGPLSRSNVVNFSVRERDRQLGNAFLLPKDRDVDVVTAVAMAGYIDPIDSPSTVTVHRTVPGESPMTIRVDLIAARYNWNENLYVQPGDIIYLNPDAAWWFRRTLDRVVPALLTVPYARAMRGWIFPGTND